MFVHFFLLYILLYILLFYSLELYEKFASGQRWDSCLFVRPWTRDQTLSSPTLHTPPVWLTAITVSYRYYPGYVYVCFDVSAIAVLLYNSASRIIVWHIGCRLYNTYRLWYDIIAY